MRKLLSLVLMISSLACVAGDRIVIGTATQGGSFAAFGQALREALAEVDPGLEIVLRPSRGSAENLPLLMNGEVDAAMVEGTFLHEQTAAKGVAPPPVLSAMFPTPGMFAVRADSPVRNIGDLRGRRVVFGASGSGFVVLARYVLDGLGLDQMRDFDAVLLASAKDGPPMILAGEAAALWGGGVGWPAFEAVARGPQGARFIGPTPEEISRVKARHPFLREMTVPAGAYPGLPHDLPTVGSWGWLMARPDLPDHLAERLTRALHAAQSGLLRRFPAAAATRDATLNALPAGAQLHPGVTKAYTQRQP